MRVMHKQRQLRGDIHRVEAYGSDHPETYGGLRFDATDPTRLVALFTDPDAHRAALMALVEHPDDLDVRAAPYSRQHLDEIWWNEVKPILRAHPGSAPLPALPDSRTPPGPGTGFGPMIALRIELTAGFDALATQLHERFGDLLDMTVGGHHFPLDLTTPVPPREAPTATIDLPDARLEVLPTSARFPVGATIHGLVRITNTSDSQRLAMESGQPLGGAVIDQAGHVVSGDQGSRAGTGLRIDLGPGERTDINFYVLTTTHDPRLGTTLPPGHYFVVLAVANREPRGFLVTPPTAIELFAPKP